MNLRPPTHLVISLKIPCVHLVSKKFEQDPSINIINKILLIMKVFVSHQQSMRAKNETFKNISTRHLKDVAEMLVLFQLIFE